MSSYKACLSSYRASLIARLTVSAPSDRRQLIRHPQKGTLFEAYMPEKITEG
jgi:hypothetical protein